MPVPLIEFENIGLHYPKSEIPALQNINLQIQEKEFFALVGASGSGKSTLLRLASGLADAGSGRVFYRGEKLPGPADKLLPGHREIRLTGGTAELHPHHTVRQNVAYDLKLWPAEKRNERTEKLLKMCGLSDFGHRKPAELSDGQKRRLMLAKALASGPKLLCADEPFNGLDRATKAELYKDLRQIIENEELSIILVTHDAEEILPFADRIAVLNSGKLEEIGSPEKLYRQAGSEYTARLLGDVSVFPSEISGEIFGQEYAGKTVLMRDENWQKAETGLPGTVSECLFYGAYFRLKIRTENGFEFYVKTPEETEPGGLFHWAFRRPPVVISACDFSL